ncbi:hypothetical protein GCM10023187_33140 [Nibrella viscosa]|uniref:SH3b domain-containing protein n=1 Tax=Nibrella viscosa TaxID=1084524 RepID=A0ABP8KMC6_9BACT
MLSFRALAQPRSLQVADSLFAAGMHEEAALLYEQALADGNPATDAMLLKLAYAYEQKGDVPRLLYYLQVYFDRHPDEQVLRRMSDIARINGLTGYETDDLNYFYLFYKQYGLYLQLLMLLLGLYVFLVLITKMFKKETIMQRHKWVVLFYLIGLLLFVNLPEGYQSGVTSHDRVFLRNEPSGAAPVADVIGRGHKVNILGSKDIWLRIFWNNQLYYIRKDNIWVI